MEERPALPPTPQITPPTDELHLPLTQPAPETSGFSEGNAQGACDGKATGNEILGRFLQNLDTAQPPLAGGIAGRKFNSVDNVHDLRYASPKTLFMQIGKSNMPPLLQELYGKLQVARSSHIFPRGSQARRDSHFHSHNADQSPRNKSVLIFTGPTKETRDCLARVNIKVSGSNTP